MVDIKTAIEYQEEIIQFIRNVCFFRGSIDDQQLEKKADAIFGLLKEQQERIDIMSEDGWHDAEKDQPKETDCYIVRIDYGVGQMTTMREYISSEGKWLKSIEEKITHWMPMPEPPKEGEQE